MDTPAVGRICPAGSSAWQSKLGRIYRYRCSHGAYTFCLFSNLRKMFYFASTGTMVLSKYHIGMECKNCSKCIYVMGGQKCIWYGAGHFMLFRPSNLPLGHVRGIETPTVLEIVSARVPVALVQYPRSRSRTGGAMAGLKRDAVKHC